MVMLRHPHPDEPTAAAGPEAARLNLLISDAGWEPESWADRIGPLLAPLGVRAHRAQTAQCAQRLIQSYPIHIAVIDMALPLAPSDPKKEAGWRVLELLRRAQVQPPTVVIKRPRTRRDEVRQLHAALRAGAFAVIDRPVTNEQIEMLLDCLRRALRRFYQDRWPQTPSADIPPADERPPDA